MIPYTIKVLLELLEEKKAKLIELEQQISAVGQRVDEEVWLLLRAIAGSHTPRTNLEADLASRCSAPKNPLGYCVRDDSAGDCIYCQSPVPDDADAGIVFGPSG